MLEHVQRLSRNGVLASSITSDAMIVRMMRESRRTLCSDEADRSLSADKPGIEGIDFAADTDPFSSSLPYGLEHAWRHNQVSPGDIGLIVSVGSGVAVGCATFRF